VREARYWSESKELELQQSIVPELGHQAKANVEAEASEGMSVSFICRLSAQTLNFSREQVTTFLSCRIPKIAMTRKQ
jgi:hypothetical protein